MKFKLIVLWIALICASQASYAGRARDDAARPRHPIILAHGIAPFNFGYRRLVSWLPRKWQEWLGTDSRKYFKNIEKTLREKGYEVYTTHVSFSSSVEQRAAELKTEINKILGKTGHSKVHIFAHSMGGLDARQMINEENMARRVVSLTTIGTPHWGTSFADVGLNIGGRKVVRFFGKALRGLENLTTESCEQFNRRYQSSEARNSVTYRVVATAQNRKQVFAPIRLAARLIGRKEGANDGLVSKMSARFVEQLSDGRVTKRVQDLSHLFPGADHLNQIGHSDLEGRNPFSRSTRRQKAEYERTILRSWLDLAAGLAAVESQSALP